MNLSGTAKSFLYAVVSCFVFILLSGCALVPNKGVTINNEPQLLREGFILNPNKEIKVGNERCQIKKIVFDRDSMTFITKGKLRLSEDVIEIGNTLDKQGTVKFFTSMGQQPVRPRLTFHAGADDYWAFAVSHKLKLIQQKVPITILVGGPENNFVLDFPGDKIDLSTSEQMVDAKGRQVDDSQAAAVRVIVGINYTTVQSKDIKDFMVLDRKDKRLLSGGNGSYTTGEAVEFFEPPLNFPRNMIKIKVIPEERLVLID